jgi:hypothetical protein
MMQPRTAISTLLLALLSVHATASVQATLERDQVSLGDSVGLTLVQQGSRSGTPDLGPLKADFDILGSSQGTSVQITNGSMSQQVQLQLTLSPKHAGQLIIPPLQWGNDHTRPLALNVAGPQTGNSAPSNQNPASAADNSPVDAAQAHVFLESTLSQNQPFVQNAVVLSVRLYGDGALTQATLDLPASPDILVQQLGQDAQSRETKNGKEYQVVERRYLLTPQKSGKLSLDGAVVNAQIAEMSNDAMFGNSPFGGMVSARPVRLRGKPIVLDVRPRPVDSSGHALLPASQLVLTESWQPNKTSINTGEPLTRHFHLAAVGVPSSSLPDLASLQTLPDGLKAYPDQTKAGSAMQGNALVSSADLDIALIASQPGHYTLPAVTLNWWDSTQNAQRSITLPARTLEVSGAAITAPATLTPAASSKPLAAPVVAPASSSLPWRGLFFGVVGLWIVTVLAWLWDRRRLLRRAPLARKGLPVPQTSTTVATLGAFKAACHANDPHTARQQLYAWALATWPDQPLSGLQQIALRLNDPSLTPLLAALDRACYGNANAVQWDGAALATQLKAPAPTQTTQKIALDLEELYPH